MYPVRALCILWVGAKAWSLGVVMGCLLERKFRVEQEMQVNTFLYAALTYTEYPLRILKFEIRAEITEYDGNGQGGACRKRCFCELVKDACGSLQMS